METIFEVSPVFRFLANLYDSFLIYKDIETCADYSTHRSSYTLVEPYPKTYIKLIQWPGALDQSFFTLLSQHHPAAVVIFAHWCVPLHNAPPKVSMHIIPRLFYSQPAVFAATC